MLWTFLRQWFWRSLRRSISLGDLAGSIVGNALTVASHVVPGWEKELSDLLWQIPVYSLAGTMLFRLSVVPYEMWREQTERADRAEAAARLVETPEQRNARFLEEARAKEAAAIRAKAEKMLDRLATRRHSMMAAGRSAQHDSHLAAMWDAEQRGEVYDELHRFTLEPPRWPGEKEAAQKRAEQERSDQLYRDQIEREQASLKAKAEMMRQRLQSRNFSIPGASDHYLAGMWDAEQKGDVYDEVHRRSLRRPS